MERSETLIWADTQSIVSGAASAAAFGLALGVRDGPSMMAMHAVGTVAVVGGSVMLSVAPLWVLALHVGLALTPDQLLAIVARAVKVTGLVLLGLSPVVALVAITAESSFTVSGVGFCALALAGALGLRSFGKELDRAVGSAPFGKSSWVKSAIAIFAALAALRLAWTLLPALRFSIGGAA